MAFTLAAPEEAAIRHLVQSYMDARNSRDGSALRNLFTADADQLVSTGEWRRGLPALLSGAMASSARELNRSRIDVESIRPVTGDVAIVDGRYTTQSAGAANPRQMWTTLVVERQGKSWKIAAIRNMFPSAPATSH